jgi:NAD(P)-dependent dehydrogenase (short-subunit alcohol dehydrogenase family)
MGDAAPTRRARAQTTTPQVAVQKPPKAKQSVRPQQSASDEQSASDQSASQQSASDRSRSEQSAGRVNPVPEYPRPPFPEQRKQDPPGLASLMDPRPDHGESSYQGSGRLRGRKALITGGDSGVGRAAAIAFAREGADVAFGYPAVEEPDALEVVQLIRQAGGKAVALPGDVRDEAFCRQLVDNAVREMGGLDIVVSNATRQHFVDRLEDLSTEQFDATFRTNVYAMFWVVKAALKHLRRGSSIICASSINGHEPSPGLIDYEMTKAAIVNFTKGMAKQVADRGIRVNAVAPGPFRTPLQPGGGQTPLQPGGGQPLDKLLALGKETPIRRPGQPAELAPIYVLLASDEASHITGQIYAAVGAAVGPTVGATVGATVGGRGVP